MVSVFPEPAPAITTEGANSDWMIGICSLVGNLNVGSTALIRVAISSAEYLILMIESPLCLGVELGKMI